MTRQFQRHVANSVQIHAAVRDVFEYLDSPARLASHMTRSSWMMGGGRMETTTDAGGGARLGSRIHMRGKAFGLSLALDEVITVYDPPAAKTWETIGAPNLVVIGPYKMGFTIAANSGAAVLLVFLQYDLPAGWIGHLLGWLFGRVYASWCIGSMLADASGHFAKRNLELEAGAGNAA